MVEWLGSPSEVRKMGGVDLGMGVLLAYSLASVTALVVFPSLMPAVLAKK